MVKEYYQVLGLTRDADQKEIKQAYRKLALRFHPDKNHAADAEERFKEIGEAYEVLSDKSKKAAYEASLASERSSSWKPEPGPSNFSSSSGAGQTFSHNYDPYSTFNRVFATDPFCDTECDEGLKKYRQARYDRYNAYRGFTANTGTSRGSDYNSSAGQGPSSSSSSFSYNRTGEDLDTSTGTESSSRRRFDDVLKRMSDREAAYKPAYSYDFSDPMASTEVKEEVDDVLKRMSDREEAYKPVYSYDFSDPLASGEVKEEVDGILKRMSDREASYKPAYSYDFSDPLASVEVKEEVDSRERHKDFNYSDNLTFQPYKPSLFTSSYSSESQGDLGTNSLDANPTQPITSSSCQAGRPTYNSYQKREEEDDISVRPVINFDPTFNPRKYLYDDDCDVDEILRKIRGEKAEPSSSTYFSPTDSLRFQEVEDERPYNLSSTSPSYSSTLPSSQIPSYSPPPSSNFPSYTSSLDSRVDCPICGLAFHQDIIERHAASCGDC